MNRISRNTTVFALVSCVVVGLAGCASSEPSSDTGSDANGLTTVTVGMLPIPDSVAFTMAVDNGYFKDEGINAKAEMSNAGAMITNLVNGSYDFALGETALIITAFDKGLPVRIKGVVTKTTSVPEEDLGKVYVVEGSPIKSPADLNGKTIAVGALAGGGELSLRAALDLAGADSKGVKFLEMPLPDMTAALLSGKVDAISTISPFDLAALEKGAVPIMSPGAEAVPHAMQVAIGTTEKFEQEHPKVVAGFLRALAKGTEYAAANPDKVREVIPKVSPVPAELIAHMRLPLFDATDPRAALTIWTDLMKRYDFVSKPVNVDELMK